MIIRLLTTFFLIVLIGLQSFMVYGLNSRPLQFEDIEFCNDTDGILKIAINGDEKEPVGFLAPHESKKVLKAEVQKTFAQCGGDYCKMEIYSSYFSYETPIISEYLDSTGNSECWAHPCKLRRPYSISHSFPPYRPVRISIMSFLPDMVFKNDTGEILKIAINGDEKEPVGFLAPHETKKVLKTESEKTFDQCGEDGICKLEVFSNYSDDPIITEGLEYDGQPVCGRKFLCKVVKPYSINHSRQTERDEVLVELKRLS